MHPTLDNTVLRMFLPTQDVVSTNERAVRLWQALGFEVIGRVPGGFAHPRLGLVDGLMMYRAL